MNIDPAAHYRAFLVELDGLVVKAQHLPPSPQRDRFLRIEAPEQRAYYLECIERFERGDGPRYRDVTHQRLGASSQEVTA